MTSPLDIELEEPPRTAWEARWRRLRDRWRGFWLDVRHRHEPERDALLEWWFRR